MKSIMRIGAGVLFVVAGTCCAHAVVSEAGDLTTFESTYFGGEHCFMTSQGVLFLAKDGTQCPEKHRVQAEIENFKIRLNVVDGEIMGARVVFVPTNLSCAGVEAWGCTKIRHSAVVMDGSSPWLAITMHELGHVVKWSRGVLGGDASHSDAAFWEAAEAVNTR